MAAPFATSEEEFRLLADALPVIIWTCNAQGVPQWVNRRWYELSGLTEQETLGDPNAFRGGHPDDMAELQRRWKHALETSSQTEVEYRIRTARGEYRWHLGSTAPVFDSSGALTRWVGVVLDIQDRRESDAKLLASERRFETVFHLIPQPTAIIRWSDAVYLLVNDAFAKLTGFSRDEVIGRTSVELGIFTPEERAAYAARVDAGADSAVVSARTRSGKQLRLALSTARVDFGGEPCRLIVGVDFTEQLATEARLRDADRRKDEFLALLSHELRNPLSPILTGAQVLKMRADAEAQADLDVIIEQTQHLVRLVDDLLDVSRVTSGKVTLAKNRLELSTVVARAVQATAPLFEKRKHRLDVSVPWSGLTIEGDEVRLTQVVDNLLSNAARYTPPGGNVAVSAAREGDDVVLRVRDSGVGIDAALLPDVFDLFVQGGRGPDRAQGGLGLGLSLVRTLTELHGGSVSAHSDGAGRGSEFKVRLPAALFVASRRVSPVPERTRWPRDTATRNTKVLLVEDNRVVADMTAKLLSAAGFETRTANDALEALELVETFHPQVAILDLGLPEIDGYLLGRQLRSRLMPAPPILIALSGYTQEKDRRRSAEAGFDLHLAKPVDADQLVEAIEQLSARSSTPA